MSLHITHIAKAVAASATPELLGSSDTQFWKIKLTARKAVGSANTGNVTIQLLAADGETWVDNELLTPGQTWEWSITHDDIFRRFNLAQIRIKVATNADGVTGTIT